MKELWSFLGVFPFSSTCDSDPVLGFSLVFSSLDLAVLRSDGFLLLCHFPHQCLGKRWCSRQVLPPLDNSHLMGAFEAGRQTVVISIFPAESKFFVKIEIFCGKIFQKGHLPSIVMEKSQPALITPFFCFSLSICKSKYNIFTYHRGIVKFK